MDLATCARPYARAVFRFAQETKAIKKWHTMLWVAVQIILNKQMLSELNKPTVGVEAGAELFIGLGEGFFSDDMKQFIRVLSKSRRFCLLPEIYKLFQNMKYRLEKVNIVEVTSAFILSDEQKQMLINKMRKRLGDEVILESRIDSSILGGVIVKVGDFVIDGSIRARLAKLADALAS